MEEAARLLNDAAGELSVKLDAGAVVVFALVMGDSGELELVAGSTGSPTAIRFLAGNMAGIGQMMERAVSGDPSEEHIEKGYVRRPPPNDPGRN